MRENTDNSKIPLSIEAEPLPGDEMETFIAQAFEDELALLEEETGVRANAFARSEAFRQVLLYWRKLHAIARKVEETEVRLVLPNRLSPKGRRYNLEGIVDIVTDDSGTMMYDLKTHDPDYIRSHPSEYAAQLDVYATIYEDLRGRHIDGTGVVATSLPERLRSAISAGDDRAIARELEAWEPLIRLPFTPESRDATIQDFGRVVDSIEEGCFSPPSPDQLEESYAGKGRTFGERVCQSCDIRYSCSSYRTWRFEGRKLKKDSILDYFRLAENKEEDEEYRFAAELHSVNEDHEEEI
jgi:hypothetical protein